MHTTENLTRSSFELRLGGVEAELSEIFPGFDERDRLGVLVSEKGGAIGASTLVLATVTAFYDFQRQRSDDFFIYPDYYVFHVGGRHGDHKMLDVWPAHKEPVVPADPEDILRALNDHGITRLLVEDGPETDPALERQTLASADNRIVTALAYSHTGRVTNGDVTIVGSEITEGYAEAVICQSTGEEDVRNLLRVSRSELLEHSRPVETYRRISFSEACKLLSPRML